MNTMFATVRNAAAIVGAAILMLAVPACSSGNGETAIAFEAYSGSASYTLKGTAGIFGQDSDIVYYDSVSLILPVRLADADIEALRDTITQYALSVTGKPIRQSINNWLKTSADAQGYTAVPDSHASDADVAHGFDFVRGFVVNLSPEMLVYCVRSDSYPAGAAHGMTTRRYINFLIDGEGQILQLNKLFTPRGLKELPARIAEQAASIRDVIGQTQVSALPANNNFYISSEGEIVFSYQPYEIASYAQGTIDIAFYPYELVDYMTPEAISIFHLRDLDD